MATAMVLVVLSVVGYAVVRAQANSLRANVDEQLEGAAESLGDALARSDGDESAVPDVIAGFGDDDAVFQVVDGDGDVRAASPDIEGAGPLVNTAAIDADADDDGVAATFDSLPHDDGPFRVLASPGADGSTIVVAASLDDVDESVDILATSLLVAVPLATAVLAVVVWFVVGRTLRPVEAIRAEVAAIGGRELHRRVPEPSGDDEVARLARTMNGMLGRIEDASRRQQRFVADASHELRSPLTRMRAELEVDLAHPEGARPEATQRSVLEEVEGLQRLVDDLLHLARSDAGVGVDVDGAIAGGEVALGELVLRAVDDLRAVGSVEVDTTGVEPVVVSGRADHLRRLVANLLDNAGRHARARVVVSLGRDTDDAVLVVADDGPGIPPADAERVFERFTRLDASRTAGAGGTGLGLAIARDIAESHGGTVAVAPSESGARFVVRLPLSGRATR